MKGRYSSSIRWRTSKRVNCQPKIARNGASTTTIQAADILPKWCSQKCGATSGNTAMDKSMPANGSDQIKPRWAPSRCVAPPVWASPPGAPAAIASVGTSNPANRVANANSVFFVPFPHPCSYPPARPVDKNKLCVAKIYKGISTAGRSLDLQV